MPRRPTVQATQACADRVLPMRFPRAAHEPYTNHAGPQIPVPGGHWTPVDEYAPRTISDTLVCADYVLTMC